MSKQANVPAVHNVKMDQKARRHTFGPYVEYPHSQGRNPKLSTKSDFVYVNTAYVGSVNSINENRLQQPPTSVIREQYWACSKWPFAQRVLVIAVGVLLGAVVSLAITVAMKGDDKDITNMFRRHPAPD